MKSEEKPHPVVRFFLLLILATFFGGGLALFVNLFVPFLNEAAFCIIAIVVMTEVLVGLLVGKCMQIVCGLRALRTAALQTAAKDADEKESKPP